MPPVPSSASPSARLPFIKFSPTDEFDVYYALGSAVSARADGDEFVDARGNTLTLGSRGEMWFADVAAHGDAAAVQARLVAAVRAAVGRATPGEPLDAKVEAFLAWMAGAPRLESAIDALGYAEHDYFDGVPDPDGGESHCKHCSWFQKIVGNSNCC